MWPENPAFVLFARDKAPWVRPCVRSILAQTYSPMTLVFSDQGSTDGTREAIEREVQTYNGPNEISLLSCPKTDLKGMPGLISHINWLHSRLDHDYWITMSADDLAGIERSARTMEIIRTLDRRPRFLATGQIFANESDLKDDGYGVRDDANVEYTAYQEDDGWIKPMDHLAKKIGGSSTNAWDPELIESLHPLPLFSLVDMYIPFCAALVDSFYFLNEVHHIYIRRPDTNNTGLEGRVRMAANDAEKLRYQELIHFQFITNTYLMLDRLCDMVDDPNLEGKREELMEMVGQLKAEIFAQSMAWAETRSDLTLARIPPMAVPI